MDNEERRRQKARLVEGMLEGKRWDGAADAAGLKTSQTAAYRLVRTEGDAPLGERRHGHPYKLTRTVCGWLVERCRATPSIPARVLRAEILNRFGVTVSVTHINRVRAALVVSNTSRIRGKKSAAIG